MTWLRHWDLRFDPFRPGAVPFVSIPGHEEAVARLVHQVEQGDRTGEVRGVAELGKSVILHEALRRLKRPGRRLCVVRRPFDEGAMIRGLCLGFGKRLDVGISVAEGMGHLLDCFRLDQAQNKEIVLAIDGDDLMAWESDRRVVDRIEALGHQGGGAVAVLLSGRSEMNDHARWAVRPRLERLTRRVTETYVLAKLHAAGRSSPVFTDRAILRLHAVAEGLPGVIDRLSSLALKAGALDQRPSIPSELVSGIAQETDRMADPIAAPN
ncbi:hypothetical protein AB1L88_04465 [Tautonia sp. JC769]|uniref:hypothetical protein n=1 Tax=Tautonia sp. JC769 TaxID=3232135 RepID=UPI00345B0B39